MRTPDGTEFELELVFVDVVKPEKLVWKDTFRRRHSGIAGGRFSR